MADLDRSSPMRIWVDNAHDTVIYRHELAGVRAHDQIRGKLPEIPVVRLDEGGTSSNRSKVGVAAVASRARLHV